MVGCGTNFDKLNSALQLHGVHRITAGEDKAYNTVNYVSNFRNINLAPDVTQNNAITNTDKTRKSRTHHATLCHRKGHGTSRRS
jgi:hypothetical protein